MRVVLLVLVACATTAPAPRSVTTVQPPPPRLGELFGQVRDKQKQPVVGMMVVIETTHGAPRSTVTDDSGFFRMQLPPDDYVVRFYFGDLDLARPATVRVGETAQVYEDLPDQPDGVIHIHAH